MKTYSINELRGIAWENAIVNAGKLLEMEKYYSIAQWVYVSAMIDKMKIEFDATGNVMFFIDR